MPAPLDRLSAMAYADLRRQIEIDYIAGRVVVSPDGWIVSYSERRLFSSSSDTPPAEDRPDERNPPEIRSSEH